jgi:uncharacterized protein (DUF2267 family)
MALNFDQFANEGNKFIKDFAHELSYPEDRPRASRVLRSLLHSLRDLLTTEENVELIAQLPMFLKAVHVEGWTLKGAKDKPIRTMDDFVAAVRQHDGRTSDHDFDNDDEVERAAALLFLVLRRYVSLGEMEHIRAVLPKRLKPMLDQVLLF